MKVAILSFLTFLGAVNAHVHKGIIVTNQEIFQLMSDSLDKYYQDLISEDQSPFADPPFVSISLNLKFDDVDLTMNFANGKLYLGEMESKSVSTSLTDSAVSAEVAFYIKGHRATMKHSTTGTVQGKAYNLVGDLAIRFNYEGNFTFAASYDDKSLTFERFRYDSFVINPSIELTGLPFDGVVQKEIISLIADEFVNKVEEFDKPLKDDLQNVKDMNEDYGGRTIQELYDSCLRQDSPC